MGRLANALQSKLNQGKSSKKLSKGDGGQLDLFTTLTERQGGGPRRRQRVRRGQGRLARLRRRRLRRRWMRAGRCRGRR